MASSVWKGYISFGLASVPVRLFAAARESHKSLAAKNAKTEEVAGGTKKKVQSIRSERAKDQKAG